MLARNKVDSIVFSILFTLLSSPLFAQLQFDAHLLPQTEIGSLRILDLEVLDVNGNEKDDFAATYYGVENKVILFENNGNNEVLAHLISDSIDRAHQIRAFYYDQNSLVDFMVLSGFYDKSIDVLINNGQNRFSQLSYISSGYTGLDLSLGDLDGDGDQDIIGSAWGDLYWYKNNGTNPATQHRLPYPTIESTHNIYLADLNNDSTLDILSFTTTMFGNSIVWSPNDGSGNFSNLPILPNSPISPNSMVVNDLDSDTDQDIIMPTYRLLTWLRNDGNENFLLDTLLYKDGYQFYSVVAGDYSGNGLADIIAPGYYIPSSSQFLFILEQTQPDSFLVNSFPMPTGQISRVKSIQFDNDSDTDLLLYDETSVYWLENLGVITGISDWPLTFAPESFKLENAYPNPFNPTTNISYRLKHSMHISLKVYDIQGKLVRVLYDGRQSSGEYIKKWDGTDYQGNPAGSGVYIVSLQSGVHEDARKVFLVR